MEVAVKIPKKLIPVFNGQADIRGAFGGRGSAKTRSFAKMCAVWGYRFGHQGITGQILCARQYMNSLADSSLEECKRAIDDEQWLSDYYDVGEKFIKSKDGRIEFTFAGLDRSIASIKSKGRILLCWVDEAEEVGAAAWDILNPTLREEGEGWNAELWVTWNPKRKGSPTDVRFRNQDNPLLKVVELNWRDNPLFPAILERKRLNDFENNPDQYPHIWEGEYVTAISGAYFAKELTKAKDEGRIGFLASDPIMKYRVFCDIGGTGAKADAFTMWVCQFVRREVRVLNYYEVIGQQIGDHVSWLQQNGYQPHNTNIYLPHDGTTHDRVYDVTYESEFRRAGYSVTTIKNQGIGAAMQRIEALRKLFPSMFFNKDKCQAGLDALGWYHEHWDDKRNIGLGPSHDWASHGADAAGLMAIVADDIFNEQQRRRSGVDEHYGSHGWMG